MKRGKLIHQYARRNNQMKICKERFSEALTSLNQAATMAIENLIELSRSIQQNRPSMIIARHLVEAAKNMSGKHFK